MGIYVRTYVKISTPQGDFIRIGGPVIQASNTISVDGGYITYPDRRVSILRLLATSDANNPNNAATIWNYLEYKCTPSVRSNISFVEIGNTVEFSSFPADKTMTTEEINSVVRRIDRDSNRVLVSTTYKVRNILGRNAQYVGGSADDGILTFASNAQAISAGQFGEFPLYALCRRSIWVLQPGSGDIAFVSISPVSIAHGLLGRDAVVNVGSTIFYLATDGLRTLPASEDNLPISFVLQGGDSVNELMKNINGDTAIGYFNDPSNGRKEIWIGAVNGIYCFSIPMKRWFMLEGVRDGFMDVQGSLIGLTEGVLRSEKSETLRTGYFKSAAMHFGNPEVTKKFRYGILRTSSGDSVIANVSGLQYEVTIEKEGIASDVYTIDVRAEERYGRRTRIQSSETIR